MRKLLIVIVSLICLPISLGYWLAWAIIEILREDDGTMWTENPLNLFKNKDDE